MSDIAEYFSMQGRVMIGRRNPDGTRAPARWVYDASVLSLAQSKTREEKTESWSGERGTAATMTSKRTIEVSLTLGQLNTDNLALATEGAIVEQASGTVTDEVIGDVKAGDVVALNYAAISSLSLVDGTSAALVEDTDYTLHPETGFITFLAAKTGVKASTYSYAAYSLVTLANGGAPDQYVLFDGLNTVDGTAKRCRGEVHKINFDAAETLGLIQDNFGDIPLKGLAKVDPVRQADPKWGPYARIILIDAVA